MFRKESIRQSLGALRHFQQLHGVIESLYELSGLLLHLFQRPVKGGFALVAAQVARGALELVGLRWLFGIYHSLTHYEIDSLAPVVVQ